MVSRASHSDSPFVRRFAAAVLAVVTAASLAFPAGACAAPAAGGAEVCSTDGEVAVVFTNDVHCAVEAGLGYAGVAAFVEDARGMYGADNVTLVDAGDAVQGDVVGTLTEGGAVVEIMNALGYDYAVPGNHEYDYGMARFDELVASSNATYLSCNFIDAREGSPVLSSYAIEAYEGARDAQGGVLEVAYVGVTTPETLTKSTPASFQDESGAYVYGFCEDETGEALYASVQRAVDAARADGADYVVAIGHLGRSGITERWSSDAVIANTTGIDAFIDGHSHEQYVTSVANEAGEDVPLAQTGTKLASVGELVIDPDADEAAGEAELSFELTTADSYAKKDAAAQSFIDGVMAEFNEQLEQVVGASEVALVSADEATNVYVRWQETNLGDLVADAYRAAVGADIGLANGGGVRASIEAGDITYGDLVSVQPFGNAICMVEATGQQILAALEMGASEYPEPSGGFLQVSGLSYTIRTDIPSSVVTDEHDGFVCVDGLRRVENVLVAGEPIDPAATYTVASHNYMLLEGGDGMTMFADAKVLLDSVVIDNQALINYIANDLGGIVGDEYANAAGAGRIAITNGPATDPDPDPDPAPDPDPDPNPNTPVSGTDDPAVPSNPSKGGGTSTAPLVQTGDAAIFAVAALVAVALIAGIVAVASRIRMRR